MGQQMTKVMPGGQTIITRGKIRDGNIAIILHNRERINCQRPNRLGRQYDHLYDRSGSREWNIDPVETLEKYCDYPKGFFVIGTWGTGYDQTDGVIATIPFSEVAGFEELPAPRCQVGCSRTIGHIGECDIDPAIYARDVGMSQQQAAAAVTDYVKNLPVDDYIRLISKVIPKETLLQILKK